MTKEAKDFGCDMPKGIALVGPPGSGKTYFGHVVSSFFELPLVIVDIGKCFGSYIGETEANTRKVIAQLEAMAPVVVIMDEIDKAFAGVGGSGTRDSGTSSRSFGTWLTWMSKEHEKTIYKIATCNKLNDEFSALTRTGRFDKIFAVMMPDKDARAEILKIHIKKKGRDPKNYDINSISEGLNNYSPAEIEQIVKNAVTNSFYDGVELDNEHIKDASYEISIVYDTFKDEMKALDQWVKKNNITVAGPTAKKEKKKTSKKSVHVEMK